MAYLYEIDQFDHSPKPFTHLYYCYRKIYDEKLKSNLFVVDKLHYQLIKTAWFYKDCDVARQKLLWWHEELTNTFNGKAQHPISKELANLNLDKVQQSLILEFVQAALAFIIYDYEINLLDQLLESLTPYFMLLYQLKLSFLNIEIDQKAQENLSYSVALNHYLYFLPDLIKQNLLLPSEYFAKEIKLDLTQLKQYQLSDNTKTFFKMIKNKSDQSFKTAYLNLNRMKKKQIKPILTDVKIWQKLIKETQKNGFNLFNERIVLSPLQMLMQSVFLM